MALLLLVLILLLLNEYVLINCIVGILCSISNANHIPLHVCLVYMYMYMAIQLSIYLSIYYYLPHLKYFSAVGDEEGCPGGGDEGVRGGTGRTTRLPQAASRPLPTSLRLPHADGQEHQGSVASTNYRVRIAHSSLVRGFAKFNKNSKNQNKTNG